MATTKWLSTLRAPAAGYDRDVLLRRGSNCPCCGTILTALPSPWTIEPCRDCKRPLVVIRPIARRRMIHVRNLLDLIGSAYGIATIGFVLAFVSSEMEARGFVKTVTILLFVIGSLLMVDGTLAMRTGIDRTFNIPRRGLVAKLLGGGKVAAGLAAFVLVGTGVSI